MNSNKLFIYTFYRFKKIIDKEKVKRELENYLSKFIVRGTILLAEEGINGSISGKENDLNDIIIYIKKILKIRILEIKINKVNFLPFNKMKVRLKKEIVSMGEGHLDENKNRGKLVPVEEWDKLISKQDIFLIDVRNNFEINIGSFEGSINPNTSCFREFAKKFNKLKIDKNSEVAMYCTGGIRCEKASSYLKINGYKKVYLLDGGVLKYLNFKNKENKKSYWNGECFVFDNRVTVNNKLQKGKYLQCYGCRHPITKMDTFLKSYEKGVSCKYCINKKSEKRIKGLKERQKQINNSDKDFDKSNFQKIISSNI